MELKIFNGKMLMLLIGLMILFDVKTFAQRKDKTKKLEQIPLSPDHWKFQADKVEFTTYKNKQAIKIQRGGGLVIAKNLVFSDGTIEFDAEPTEASTAPFVTVYFRFQDEKESECFYLRVGREENHKRNDAAQYAPFVKGVNIWDMLPQYQGPARINNKDWNHIKLVISGMQLIAYVNDMSKPVLRIPYLEGNSKQGTIAFEGFAAFANLVVKPNVVEGLAPSSGVDLTDHDANYIRRWMISQPKPLPPGRELHLGDLPGPEATFDMIDTERNGLINVTRKFGVGERQYVWLRAKINSTEDVKRKIELGFSD